MKILKPPPFHSGNMKGILVVKIKNGTSHLLPKRYSRQAVIRKLPAEPAETPAEKLSQYTLGERGV